MKPVKFTFIFLTLLFLVPTQGSFLNSFKLPGDRVYDEVRIFPLGFEFKLNSFLSNLSEQLGVDLKFHLIESLRGQDIDEFAKKSLSNSGSENALVFVLSLSDRQFKVLPHPNLEYKLSDEDLNHLIKLTLPAFKQANYPLGIQLFLQNLVYTIDPQSSLYVPYLDDNKNKTMERLFFFIIGILILFILGHKIGKGFKVIHKDNELIKENTHQIGIFWK